MKGVIWTASFIKTHEVLEVATVRRMTLPQFMQEMMEDEVISLYVKNSPPLIVYYVKTEIKNFYDLLPEFFGESLPNQSNNNLFNEINNVFFDQVH